MEQADRIRQSWGGDQIRVKQSEGKWKNTLQIGAEQEHHVEKEYTFKKRRKKRSEKIKVESEKSSVEQSGASSVVQNNTELGEDPIREGRQITAAEK